MSDIWYVITYLPKITKKRKTLGKVRNKYDAMNIADNITHNGVYDTDVQCVRVFKCSEEGNKIIYKGGDRDAIGFAKNKVLQEK